MLNWLHMQRPNFDTFVFFVCKKKKKQSLPKREKNFNAETSGATRKCCNFFAKMFNRKKKVVKVWWMSVKPIQHIFTSNHHQSLANIKNLISTNFYVSKQTIDSKKNFRKFSQKLLQNSLIRLWDFLCTKTTFSPKLDKTKSTFPFLRFFCPLNMSGPALNMPRP